ncbi:MAG TPA: serine hydrolase, partial [Chitinophagaceae bacterium]|nr:serine hydrolase [Chitinophagaceae bacterium]
AMNRKNFIPALLLGLLTNIISAQDNIPSFVKDSLDNYTSRALKEWQVPGAAVCIIKDGKVVLMKGYGVKEINGTDKVDENTLFMIGSNSKAFTATALAMLDAGQAGKFSLDDKVTKWIPEFALDNKAAGEQAIIRDLLCHRIGFQTFQGDFTYWTSNLTRKEVIEKMRHIKAMYPFRTTWGYTNAAFLTAGEIIPKVTGMQWEDYLKEKIFIPLGMNNTLALSKDYPSAPNKCQPHTIDNGKLIKIPICAIDNLAAAGSISSSVNDMSKWVLMQLNNGKLDGKQIIPAAALAQTRLPHSILGNGGHLFNKGHFALYGLGWFLEEYSGRKIVSHTGGVNGFVTSVTMIPEENLGIIVFTNTDQNAFYEALKWEIADAYLGNTYRNYSQVYLARAAIKNEVAEKKDKVLQDSAALKPAASLPLTAYAGNYFNDVYGDMTVVMENKELRMKFSHHPNMYAKLEALGGNRFYVTFSDPIFSKAVFPFKTENGKVTGVTVKVADFVEYNPYEFVKK